MATSAPTAVIDGTDPFSKVMAHYDKSELTEQVYSGCALLDKKVIKVLDEPGVQGQVQIRDGGFKTTGWSADGGAKPDPVSKLPKVGQYDLAVLLSTLQWGRAAFEHIMNRGSAEQVVNFVERELKAAKEDQKSKLGVALFSGSGSLGSPAAQLTADSATSFTISDASGFRIGNDYQIYDGATLLETFTVTGITYNSDPSGNDTVTFSGEGAAGVNDVQWDTTDDIYPRGAKDNAMVGLSQVTAASSLYGVAQTTHNWISHLSTGVGALTKTKIKRDRRIQEKLHGPGITHWAGSGAMEMHLNDLMVGQRRYPSNSGRDELLGGEIDIYGAPFVKDNWCPEGDLYGFDNEYVMLHQFRKIMAERDFDNTDPSRQSVHRSYTHYAVECDIAGHFNLRCEKRAAVMRMTGITAPA